jgi:hypothetical protein
VRLEPGWGEALVFTETSGGAFPEERGPIAGVEVRADGVVVARSDEQGLAVVSLAREPGKLECDLAGWIPEEGRDADLGLDDGGVKFVKLMRE